jgi:AraC-like DNA-binding protein
MNNSQVDTIPYVGLTEHNYQQVDYTDGDLIIINHLAYHSRMHTTQVDMVFIAFCHQGLFTFEMDGHEYTIGKDDVFIGHPNAIYDNYEMSADLDCRLFCLSKNLLLSMLYPNQSIWNRALYLNKYCLIHLNDIQKNRRDHIIELLIHNIKDKNDLFRKEIIHSLVQAIIYKLCRTLSILNHTEVSKETNQRKVLFDKFITILSTSEIKKYPLSYYADKLYVSPRYLTMVSREISGKTAFDWISEYVQNDVRYYLRNSNLTIKEISVKLGFCNLSFFGKYVRENFGMSPSEYRKHLKKK